MIKWIETIKNSSYPETVYKLGTYKGVEITKREIFNDGKINTTYFITNTKLSFKTEYELINAIDNEL